MNVVILQHVVFEDIGYIKNWLDVKKANLHYVRFYQEEYHLPDLDHVDLLIIMGGPMSVNDEHLYHWLNEEKNYIKQAIEKKVATLGICLGSQLIANSLGYKIYKNKESEIGWFPVFSQQNNHDVFKLPDHQNFFHWHGETFELPEQAVLLGSSQACINQAFQIGTNIIGLQFHPEMTPEIVNDLLLYCGDEISEGNFVQSANALKEISIEQYQHSQDVIYQILEFITS